MEQGFSGCLGKAVAVVLTFVLAAAVISLLFRLLILLLPPILEVAVFAAIVYLALKIVCKVGEALR